jgi:hypothetical protein
MPEGIEAVNSMVLSLEFAPGRTTIAPAADEFEVACCRQFHAFFAER